jgi:hypothetical protein
MMQKGIETAWAYVLEHSSLTICPVGTTSTIKDILRVHSSTGFMDSRYRWFSSEYIVIKFLAWDNILPPMVYH